MGGVVAGGMGLKILLVDVDSKMPNLALMKLSAWHEARGDKVRLLKHRVEEAPLEHFDKVYISCIFSKNAKRVRRIERGLQIIKGTNSHAVEIGGYGVNGAKLPSEIEHTMPDYSLYDCGFSMGFTSRGCIRNCPWCIVPEKEGGIRDHAPITEFLPDDFEKVILFDNNFKASPRWRENLKYIIDHGIKVNFTQGLDIRLMDEEFAGMLAECDYRASNFKDKQLYFSFDAPEIESEIMHGVETLRRAGIPIDRHHITFYMLVGFGVNPKDYTWNYFVKHDYYRFKVLRELGVRPYVMLYNDRRDIPLLRYFRQWANCPRRWMKTPNFEDHDRGYSQTIIQRMRTLEGYS